jgi:HAMP domain-containing protein
MTTPTAATPSRRFNLNLTAKLIIGFTLLFTIVFVGAFYWFYVFSTERSVEKIVTDMHQTVLGAAAGLEGESLLRLAAEGVENEAGGSDHPDYAAQMAWLATVQLIEPRAWPYTYVAGSEPNQIIALVDLWFPTDPSKAYGFQEIDYSLGFLTGGLRELMTYVPRGDRCEDVDVASGAFGWLITQGRALACRLLRRVGYTDAYGSWVSAYAPVFGSDGRPLGAIGVDFEMQYVDDVQNALLASTGRAFLITYAALMVLLVFASQLFTRPIVRLTTLAARVGEGDYDVDFAPARQKRWRDEIGVLTDVLAGMVDKVRVREQTLRKQVQELRIEIDEVKRKEQVAEIVDTDFFRDLQSKAANMRSRKSRGGGEAAKGGEPER